MRANDAGTFTSAAGAIETVELGYEPSYVEVNNVTANTIARVYNDGTNTAGSSIAGATGVVTQADATVIATENGFTVAAASLTTSDVVYYKAERLY